VKISVIGAGYVGLATAISMVKNGNEVILHDIDAQKLRAIGNREDPINEPGISEALKGSTIAVSNNFSQVIPNTEVHFICVGTSDAKGQFDLKSIKSVATDIGKLLSKGSLVVIKSTVVPETTEKVVIPLLELGGRKAGIDFGVCVNPEFLRVGSALRNALYPDRIIIGELDKQSGDKLAELYQGFNCSILRMDLKTAEIIKCASNSFLATKISFINEIGNICKILGIDVYEVARGMGYDSRIGNKFLNAGCGFGGSCLPKDLAALITCSRTVGYEPKILEQVLKVNEEQPVRMIGLLKKHIPELKDKVIGILGLAFKPNTADVRDSVAINIVATLLAEGAKIKAYDPKAIANFQKLFPQIEYGTAENVLNSDAILILTGWDEFNRLDYRGKIIIDGRRVLKAKEAFLYEGLCW
jgi:UDPglucose 6-dehydrogenase